MKTKIKKLVLIALIISVTTPLFSQSQKRNRSRIPLLDEAAPSFIAESTKGTIHFPADYGQKWKIILSHPADFTPVCTTELMALAQMQQNFKDLNVELVVVSTDPVDKHLDWVKSMEEMMNSQNNSTKINFPLVDDSKLNIGWQYGMFTASHQSHMAQRGVFIIDPQNKIRSINFYPLNVGRNMDEIKRTIIALQTAEKNTVLIPANWKPGEDVLIPYPNSLTHYDQNKVNKSGSYNLSWYMLYEKLDK